MNIQFLEKPPLAAKYDGARLIEVTEEYLPTLQKLFRAHTRMDTYLLSPAYFAMTGRKGLWIYGDDDTFMMLARHPNTPDKTLLFPPMGKNPVGLLNHMLRDKIYPNGELQMARLGPEDGQLARVLKQWGIPTNEKEEVLDWAYPVHILDTDAVSLRSGHDFRDFRKNINRAFNRNTWSQTLDPNNSEHIKTIQNIAFNWATHHAEGRLVDLLEPTLASLNLMQSGKLPVSGLLTYEGSSPVGFIIWEETDPARGIANSIAGLSIGDKGVDEFAMLKMCEQLRQRGFHQVCIGGSETPGLDAFKRKMNPIESVPLQSAHLN